MAGSITVSSITLDSDNNFSIKSNTGATLFFANTTGIDVANSIGATAITNDKILSVANTKISGNIISSQIASVNGSVITANTIANSAIQTGAVENYMSAVGLDVPMRNRIINGAMVIDQRNDGASVTPTDGTYTVDRWQYSLSQTSKLTAQQSSTAATGFIKSLLTTSSSAYSILAADYFMINQRVEGLNVFDLGWGAAGAAAVTLSFWVRSSLTGTFGGAINNAANDRSYPFTYTISVANTYEYKTVTIAGDTGGTWLTTNGVGMSIRFGLGVGSTYSGTAGAWAAAGYFSATGATSVVGTNGATFYITGVQLEKGSKATPFGFRNYGTELALCQRYFTKFTGDGSAQNGYAIGYQSSTTVSLFCLNFPVTMRSEPTCILSNVQSSDGITYDTNLTLSGITAGFTSGQIEATNSSVGAQFRPFRVLGTNNASSFISLSSEL